MNHRCRWCGGMVTSWNHQRHGERCMTNEQYLREHGFTPATYKMTL